MEFLLNFKIIYSFLIFKVYLRKQKIKLLSLKKVDKIKFIKIDKQYYFQQHLAEILISNTILYKIVI